MGFPERAGSAPRSPHPRLPSASPTTVPPQGGSGTEPEQALEANKPLPSRTARKLHHPPQSLLSARRLGPAKPQPTTHPKRQPNDQPTPRRQRDRAGASLGGEQTTPSRTARKLQSSPEPPQRAQARSREALTHDPPQAPAQRLNHPAAAGPGLSVRADNQSRSSTSTKAPVAFSGTGFTTHRRF
jgi:hypothetical protein